MTHACTTGQKYSIEFSSIADRQPLRTAAYFPDRDDLFSSP
ncbi:hypothetical protein [Tychonema sp. LEGE 07203]|nr:hypothetical protein [Tychonema sp. LEGE 07203]